MYNAPQRIGFNSQEGTAPQQTQYYQYPQQPAYFLNNGVAVGAPTVTPQAPSFGPRYVQHHHQPNAPNPHYKPEEYEAFTNNPHQQYSAYQTPQPVYTKHGISQVITAPQQPAQQRPNLIGARFYRKDNSIKRTQQPIRPRNQSRGINYDVHRMFEQPGIVNLSRFDGKPIVVEYDEFEGGDRRLGLVMKSNQQKWEIISTDGNTKQLEEHQFTFQWPQDQYFGRIEDVKNLQEQCEMMLSSVQMAPNALWSQLYSTGQQIVTCQDVAPYLFGQVSPYTLYATHRYLTDNISYFKPTEKQLEFNLRDVQEINELFTLDIKGRDSLFKERLLIAKIANLALKAAPNAKDSVFYKGIKTNSIHDMRALNPNVRLTESMLTLDEHRDANQLREMRQVALGQYPHLNSDLVQQVNTIFSRFGVDVKDNSLFEFMHKKLNLFDTPNIHFLRSGYYNYQMPENILHIASQIKLNPLKFQDLDSKIRRDLRHHKVYTVDDYPATEEVDDGISLEVREDGTEIVYIHIADPTRYIRQGDELDTYAAQRTTSIYLPETKIPMLPRDLSVDIMSLSEKKENFAMTFCAQILPDGSLANCDIFPSVISKVQRIDYEEVDQILEKVCSTDKKTFETLQTLMRLANIRWKHRLQHGAAKSFTTPRPKIVVDGERITVSVSNELSRSRRMIQELMIVANQVSANFAHERGIIVPYRGTMGGKLPRLPNTNVDAIVESEAFTSEQELVSQILEEHNEFKNTSAACVSQTPNWHEGIGVSAYTQVTSPIRRYSDLLVHHQLKANLRGEKEPLSWTDIQTLLAKMETTTKSTANLQKSSERFWLLKFFENEGERTYRALVMESSPVLQGLIYSNQAFIYLMDIGFKTVIKTDELVKEGSFITVIASTVNPIGDLIEFVQV
jgi:exoribonuclease-2